MNSFLKGFFSIFSWFDCFNNISPKERVDEILDDFYSDNPHIIRNDNLALQKDFESIKKDAEYLWK